MEFMEFKSIFRQPELHKVYPKGMSHI